MSDPAYEQAYRDGESNRSADWAGALSEVLPDDVDCWSVASVVAYIQELQQKAGLEAEERP